MAEGGPNRLRIVSAVMAENSVPLISPRYKFTIGTSGEALSARTPSPSRHPSQINTQAAQADLPIVGSLLTRGLQAGHLQDDPPPQPQREAYGNDGIEHLCVRLCLHITIPHSRQCADAPVQRLHILRDQVGLGRDPTQREPATREPVREEQPPHPEHSPFSEENESPRRRLPGLELVGDAGDFAEPYEGPDRCQREALPGQGRQQIENK